MNVLITFLTHAAVAPFSAALLAVVAVGILEVVLSLIVGAGLTDATEAVMAGHDLPDTGVTNWLLLKEIPILMAILTLFAGYGIGGLATQGILNSLLGEPFSPALPVHVVGALTGFGLLRGVTGFFRKLRMTGAAAAIEPAEFIGGTAVLTSPTAYPGYPGAANYTDKNGYTHIVMVEPEFTDVTFKEGDRIELSAQASASLFQARKA